MKPDVAAGPLGAHPVGTGLGAVAGGAAAGALAGTVAGPVGTVAGGWRAPWLVAWPVTRSPSRSTPPPRRLTGARTTRPGPTSPAGQPFDEYGPAYRYGVDTYGRYEGRSFEQAEPELMRDWDRAKGTSKLTWENAKHATRDSWQRLSDFVERATPGDSDRTGSSSTSESSRSSNPSTEQGHRVEALRFRASSGLRASTRCLPATALYRGSVSSGRRSMFVVRGTMGRRPGTSLASVAAIRGIRTACRPFAGGAVCIEEQVMTMNKDQVKGRIKEAKGKIKEVARQARGQRKDGSRRARRRRFSVEPKPSLATSSRT